MPRSLASPRPKPPPKGPSENGQLSNAKRLKPLALRSHFIFEVDVPGLDGSGQVPVEVANSQLTEGLRSCRAVVKNYRSLLASSEAYASESSLEPLNAELRSLFDG